MEKTNINDTLRTLIRGLVGVVIVLGVLYLMFTSTPDRTDYDLCINKCPTISWGNENFANLECPEMCAELKCKVISKISNDDYCWDRVKCKEHECLPNYEYVDVYNKTKEGCIINERVCN